MRTCEWCGVSVVSKRADARFCSSTHRIYAHRAQKASGGIPPEMLRRDRWIRYAPSKAPLRINGHAASSTDPRTWSSHTDAVASRAGVGLGYVLGDGIGCIDLDHCIIDGEISSAALEFIAYYPGNYIEISPSGDGLHVWGLLEEQPGKRYNGGALAIERYSVGRYITVTGNVYQHGGLLPL